MHDLKVNRREELCELDEKAKPDYTIRLYEKSLFPSFIAILGYLWVQGVYFGF